MNKSGKSKSKTRGKSRKSKSGFTRLYQLNKVDTKIVHLFDDGFNAVYHLCFTESF